MLTGNAGVLAAVVNSYLLNMAENNAQPATRQDLAELKVELVERIDGVELRLAERIDSVELRLAERIERAESAILNGFRTYTRAQDLRMTALDS